jgi:hypothetical protein
MLSLYQIFIMLNNSSGKKHLKELTMICYCRTEYIIYYFTVQIEIDREMIK